VRHDMWLVDVGEVDIPAEVLDRLERELRGERERSTSGALQASHVPGDPVRAILGANDLEPWEPLENAGQDELRQHPLGLMGPDDQSEGEIVSPAGGWRERGLVTAPGDPVQNQ